MITPKQEMYEAPRLVALESLDRLTLGAHTGGFTDANFPAHTPVSQLTFS